MPQAGKKSADFKPAIDAVERGIRYVNSVPRIDNDSEQYRKRLLDLLNAQKTELTQTGQMDSNSLARLDQEENSLADRYNQFASDYSKWLPGFLKGHGYELNSGDR